jgi:mannose-6-phosphate isomerase-like protein (cupin superfamily)
MCKGANLEITSIKSAEHYVWGKQCDGWHLVKSKNLSVIQERVPSGKAECRHYHSESEQFFYILSGVATIELNDTIFTLGANQGIHIPSGGTHQLRNQHKTDLVFIVTSTPPSHGDRIEVE